MSPNAKTIAKIVIALVVLIGLGLTVKKSFDALAQQRDATLQTISQLDQQIQSATSQVAREGLRRERELAAASLPELSNVSWAWLAIAALTYSVGMIPGGMVLLEAVGTFGLVIGVKDAIISQTIGHVGKYVPGKAMVVVIRAGRLKELGIPWLAGSTAVFMETIMMMAVGAALSGAMLLWLPVPRWMGACALFAGLAATTLSLPPILYRIIDRLGIRRVAQEPSSSQRSVAPPGGWRFFTAAWLWHLLGWILIGGSFGMVLISLPGLPEDASRVTLVVASIAAMALAMVVGFASLLPGGAGARELALTVVLSPVVGTSVALFAAIVARILFIVVDVGLAIGLGACPGYVPRPSVSPTCPNRWGPESAGPESAGAQQNPSLNQNCETWLIVRV
ncbi:YbhN family protein [Rhodopirellula sp. MGV]|uniref:lysylphosphatidylglycerol synthase transmembrane domain-containing protein n=1 Tax=Rhodopirellula sp. MGV TaxID=2023130 RepID=UPI0013042F17|nr:lysylphosphatidylglycerol synthase transmembrane domain-containing protein [Rhodopirellula sp. MGV]